MKKLPKQLKDDLVQLRGVQMHADQKKNLYFSLLQELQLNNSSKVNESITITDLLTTRFHKLLARHAWRPVGVVAIIVGIVVGPGIAAVSASMGSLPGEPLYGLKRGVEKAQISLALTEKKKAELEIEFVANRVYELHRLTKEQAPSPERAVKIEIALNELKKDTDSVKGRLEKVNAANSGQQQTIELAKTITEKSEKYQETLQEASEDSDQDIQEALTTVQKVAIEALDVLADKHKKEQAPTISQEDLGAKVNGQLAQTRASILSLRQRIALKNRKIVIALDNEKALLESTMVAEQPKSDTATAPTQTVVDPTTKTTSTTSNTSITPTESKSVTEEKKVVADDVVSVEVDNTEEINTENSINSSTDAVPKTEEPKAPTLAEQKKQLDDLTARLDGTVEEQMLYIKELLLLQDFSTSLQKLTKINEQLDGISKELVTIIPPEVQLPEQTSTTPSKVVPEVTDQKLDTVPTKDVPVENVTSETKKTDTQTTPEKTSQVETGAQKTVTIEKEETTS